jgi:hypothetical protein
MSDASTDELGSLAQAARSNELKTARGILFVIGALTIVANAIFMGLAKSNVDEQIEQEIANVRAQGMEIDEAKVEEVRTAAYREVMVANAIGIALGVVFVLFGLFVYRKPVPITIAALVLYIGSNAAYGLLDPTMLAKGIIIKILIVVGLFKAVQAAIASEKEMENAALGPLAPTSNPV